MGLINGINHLTFITADIDRLIAFYRRVFEARVTLDLEEEGLHHVFIEVGPHIDGGTHFRSPPSSRGTTNSRCFSAGGSTISRSTR
jgi:catechol 2,3-dioxygenase-like lactoylglutathione lyase family enzyme